MNDQGTPTWAAVNSAAELGMYLRHVRERRGLSQEDLADELGIDRRYVYQIESGTPTLYTRRLFALLRLLEVRMEVHAR
ncbi:MAG: helix-turn-helix domain-containing protein [Cellulomonas sp.]|uniref:helix-turn-helix transcriptional regulator n=1 Tax=Cellulomonas sp. TaxID=40001 RepID=UPI001A038A7E|nr:helix-turn-helix domain-containing protein [Cellulomonas sp.]MBF0688335.1 helix-turn-helix domain-containing protein [Cellulomonas sp.]